jgi:hypothetical protein
MLRNKMLRTFFTLEEAALTMAILYGLILSQSFFYKAVDNFCSPFEVRFSTSFFGSYSNVFLNLISSAID